MRNLAEVALEPAFHEFKLRFIILYAHVRCTHPHPFPTNGHVVGDPTPLDVLAGAADGIPPPPPCATHTAATEDPAPAHPVVSMSDGNVVSDGDESPSNIFHLMFAVVDAHC